MNKKLPINSLTASNTARILRQEQRMLLKAFWLGVLVLLLFEIYTVKTSSITSILSATLISIAALMPLYLWCSGRALGIPIFPVFALTYLWTYALPLVSEHPKVMAYPSEKHLFASITVTVFLLLGTFVWFQFVKKVPSFIPRKYQAISSKNVDEIFFIVLGISIIYFMGINGGWFNINAGFIAIIKATILGCNALSVFILSYRYGNRTLPKIQIKFFLCLLSLYIVTSIVSLLLVVALSTILLAAIAFILGRHRIPWLPLILVLLCFSFLHYGKTEMRDRYWQIGAEPHYVQPWEYPAWYAEWIGYSFEYVSMPEVRKQEKQSFGNRASLMHLLLLAQTKTPRDVPYLSGATYAIIPKLLIPRIFNQKKMRSHEGTYILNIHYGLQDRMATFRTTIGWGLLNEAYANFGLVGCVGLSIILGAFFGQISRWCLNTPILSARSFFAVILTNLAFRSEYSASVFITSLFQSSMALTIIVFMFMSNCKQNPSQVFSYVFGNSNANEQISKYDKELSDL